MQVRKSPLVPHVCPWWLGYFMLLPLRRLYHNPKSLLAPHVTPGMTVLEPGCGMGYFTLDLARLVGPSGRVVAVDLQEKMLAGLRRRAARTGLLERIDARRAEEGSMGLDDLAGRVDFALLFAMVHEVPDARRFFAEVAAALKPGGVVLFAEPRGHVSASDMDRSLDLAREAGLHVRESVKVSHCHAARLEKSAG